MYSLNYISFSVLINFYERDLISFSKLKFYKLTKKTRKSESFSSDGELPVNLLQTTCFTDQTIPDYYSCVTYMIQIEDLPAL